MFKCLAPIRNFNLENMKCGKGAFLSYLYVAIL